MLQKKNILLEHLFSYNACAKTLPKIGWAYANYFYFSTRVVGLMHDVIDVALHAIMQGDMNGNNNFLLWIQNLC